MNPRFVRILSIFIDWLFFFLPDINECLNEPCKNGATCVDDVGSFHCICAPGFTGETCRESKLDIFAPINVSFADTMCQESMSTIFAPINGRFTDTTCRESKSNIFAPINGYFNRTRAGRVSQIFSCQLTASYRKPLLITYYRC